MKENALYDNTSPANIEKYSKKLVGKTFKNIIEDFFYNHEDFIIRETAEDTADSYSSLEWLKNKLEYYNNPKGKGSLGNLIEEYFFLYKPNSDSRPDFEKASVELKVTPYEKTKKGKIRAGERLVITMIPNNEPIEDEFYESKMITKLKLILLILYFRDKSRSRIDYQIDYSKLFSIFDKKCEEDLLIIKNDYNIIIDKIKSGKANELSEGDTYYLGACTKGSTAEKNWATQYYNSSTRAKRRAFCLKQGYMTSIINKYIIEDVDTYEPIFKDPKILENSCFEKEIFKKMEKYIGKSKTWLMDNFDIKTNAKNMYSILAFRMLGIASNQAEEFVKADIKVKAIRIEKNGEIKEHMSFPTFIIKEFIKEEWEESKVYNYFSENKFFFMLFKNDGVDYIFRGVKFWNMPLSDLENFGKQEWQCIQNVFKTGVELNPIKQKNRTIVENNLPKASETNIFHVRLHAGKTAYLINGIKYGNGTLGTHTDELPNGDLMTKQCFWLNKEYVLEQIKNN